VADTGERLFQIFGRETSNYMLPTTAEMDFTRAGLPEPPPWKREADYVAPEPGYLRMTGFVSKPELQKLNRNSIYVFVNQRLIRDKLILHALNEAYRNILPPTSYPVVLLFLEMPPQEVDVNVHPAKTEVRYGPHYAGSGAPRCELRHGSHLRSAWPIELAPDRRKPVAGTARAAILSTEFDAAVRSRP
jgi:hypothetical protein